MVSERGVQDLGGVLYICHGVVDGAVARCVTNWRLANKVVNRSVGLDDKGWEQCVHAGLGVSVESASGLKVVAVALV